MHCFLTSDILERLTPASHTSLHVETCVLLKIVPGIEFVTGDDAVDGVWRASRAPGYDIRRNLFINCYAESTYWSRERYSGDDQQLCGEGTRTTGLFEEVGVME